ncbi:MAG: tRNA lysidine(34) synthetase TilS [Coriobacteriia bacterium]|nr:tRNA lysidine(34) synthetase TilS [Coriobacteriia bacterium]
MTSFIDTARQTVARHDLLPEDAPVVVMVSGGADSVALLRLLSSGELGVHRLRVLHVNHLLRGDHADADERFVRELCEELDVEHREVRFDVAALARADHLNLEDAGRRVRYRFADDELDALCDERGVARSAGRIAVAHTLDDRIETFFMRAIAGAGAGALASIAARRGRVVRPLIDCERAGLREYLEQLGASWREDASNSDTERSRAFVRSEILPAAQRLNPAFRVSMRRTMDLLADDDALLGRLAGGFARDFAQVVTGEARFNREWMRSLERTMARRTVRDALGRAFPDASRLEADHIEALVDGLADDAFARDLPGGLRAECEYGTLVVSAGGLEGSRLAPGLLPLPGQAALGRAGTMLSECVDVGDTTGSDDSIVIDAGAVGTELTVGPWLDGERMRPLGMPGRRKLSDLLTDAKVPRRLRGLVPVVRDGERVVWLAGVRMSDEFRVGAQTQHAVRLTWERGVAWRTTDETGA